MRGVLLASVLALAAPALAHAAPPPVTWCGTDEVAADRVPQVDVSASARVRFVYAVPSDGADHLFLDASGIATDAAAIDAWWRRQDPTRTPRFDRYPFPGCGSPFGQLDLGFVRLPHDTAYYTSEQTPADLLDGDLATALSPPDAQKTIVYFDGPISDPRVCGETDYRPLTTGGRFGFAYVYLDSSCDLGPPGAGATAAVAVHELLHNLGAVPDGAPNACPGDLPHVCDSAADILYPFLSPGDTLDSKVLDVGRNDYYGHDGPQWDVQDSIFLAHLPLRHLHVSVQGSGSVVSTAPAELVCTKGCDVDLDDGTAVQLAGRPAAGWAFAGWSGSCVGLSCSLQMDGDRSLTARFVRPRVLLSVSVRGRGRVVSAPAGISCPRACSSRFAGGSAIRLSARAGGGYRFAGWSGGCAGRGSCTVRLQRPASVVARFVRR